MTFPLGWLLAFTRFRVRLWFPGVHKILLLYSIVRGTETRLFLFFAIMQNCTSNQQHDYIYATVNIYLWVLLARGRLSLLLRTTCPVPFSTCIVLMLRPFIHEFVMSSEILSLEHRSLGTSILLLTYCSANKVTWPLNTSKKICYEQL